MTSCSPEEHGPGVGAGVVVRGASKLDLRPPWEGEASTTSSRRGLGKGGLPKQTPEHLAAEKPPGEAALSLLLKGRPVSPLSGHPGGRLC